VAVALATLAYGLLLRLWILAHVPLFGDEAVAGLMARRIGAGHFSVFYWGQDYGGVEPYVTALLFRLGGSGPTSLNMTPAVLAALAAGLVAAIVRAAGGRRPLALAAGAAAWVFPYTVLWNSVREVGFRYATLCCGLAAVLCAVRIQHGRAGLGAFAALGLALGVGWWAAPEIVYFVPPCLVLLLRWWLRGGGAEEGEPERVPAGRLAKASAVAGAGFLFGSIPWWYANIGSGFASLRVPATLGNGPIGYDGRLSVLLHYMLPMQLGLRVVPGGAWVGGPHLGHLLYASALALVGACLMRAVWLVRHDAGALTPLALGAGVVAFPFIYAAVPASAYWIDGRYGLYLPFLVVPLVALSSAWQGARRREALPEPGSADPPPRRSLLRRPAPSAERRRVATLVQAGVGMLGVTVLTLGGAHAAGIPTSPGAFFSGWGDPNAPMQRTVDDLVAHHIGFAYGDYWTAYDLEFIGQGRVAVSPTKMDVERWPSLLAQVRASRDPAWLFFAPGRDAGAVFSNPQPGPGPYTEATFETFLKGQGIAYRVVPLGVLDAVIPAHRVMIP